VASSRRFEIRRYGVLGFDAMAAEEEVTGTASP